MSAPTCSRLRRVGPREKRPYALRSLLFHEQCGRRMQGNWNHGHAHYRCRYPQEYALANKIDHPLTVYVREDAILPALDAWLASAFDPDRLQRGLVALDEAQPEPRPDRDPLRAAIADCDRKLARHRAALEAGADPTVVTEWITQTQAERAMAVAALARTGQPDTPKQRLTPTQITDLVDSLGGLLTVLANADPADKGEIYRELGLRLTYDDQTESVIAEATPRSSVCVVSVSEAGLVHYAHLLDQRQRLPIASLMAAT